MMPIGSMRQGVEIASFSLNFAGNLSELGGAYFVNSPAFCMISCTPRLASTTSKPGLPARHSFSARSATPVAEARQYSTRMPYFFSKPLLITSIACGTAVP